MYIKYLSLLKWQKNLGLKKYFIKDFNYYIYIYILVFFYNNLFLKLRIKKILQVF